MCSQFELGRGKGREAVGAGRGREPLGLQLVAEGNNFSSSAFCLGVRGLGLWGQ